MDFLFVWSRKSQKVRVPEYTFSLLPLNLVQFGFCTNLFQFRFSSLNKLVERTDYVGQRMRLRCLVTRIDFWPLSYWNRVPGTWVDWRRVSSFFWGTRSASLNALMYISRSANWASEKRAQPCHFWLGTPENDIKDAFAGLHTSLRKNLGGNGILCE